MSGERRDDLCANLPFDGATGFRDPQPWRLVDQLELEWREVFGWHPRGSPTINL